ncbi:MAG: type II CAAX endopeptidase family protein [Phycisphaerae bacterium]|nr:type II CAAX endopeptidase family protein [Phycisphaerae bacterium]
MPNFIDHGLALLLVVIAPPLVVRQYRRFVALVDSDGAPARRRAYWATTARQWFLVLIVVTLWLTTGRPFAALGVSVPSGVGFAIGAVLVAILASLFFVQLRESGTNPAVLAAVRAKLLNVRAILPHNDAELRRFAVVALTAGICEEMLFRGFLTWYATQFVPVWAAIVLVALSFGLGHAYQGVRGVALTALVGLVMACLCLMSGSLWLAMIAHALIDLNAGILARRAFGAAPFNPPLPEVASSSNSSSKRAS